MGSPTAGNGHDDAALVRAIRQALADAEPGARMLDEPARFLLETARQREGGAGVLAIEAVPGGGARRQIRIAAINPDMPFLVDSIAAAIAAQGLGIDRLVHPVLPARRDAAGGLAALGEGDCAESFVYAETARADARTRVRLRAELEATLADVRAAVADWPALRRAMAADAAELEGEAAALLHWFEQGGLTLLGHVVRQRDGRQSGALGICRKSVKALLAPASYARAFACLDADPARHLLIVKANHASRVHRRAPLDLFIVPRRENGRLVALSVHAGIWASAALMAPPEQVPVLRRQLAALMARHGFDPRGHDGKALVHALARLPHDLAISLAEDDLDRVAIAMMSLVDRPRPRLLLVRAPLERHLFAFVWLPRDSFSTAVRLQVQAMLEQAAAASVLDWSLEVEGSNLAALRFVLDIRDGDAGPDEAALEARLIAMQRGWADAVEAELAASGEGPRAAALAARYADAFPLAYRQAQGPAEAARDIVRLHRLSRAEAGQRDVRLQCPAEDGGPLWLKVYQHGGSLVLSDVVPALENFGFRVLEADPVELGGEGLGAIHDFHLALPPGNACAALVDRSGTIEAAIAAVLGGAAESDAFNRLVIAAGLGADEADWLRAWFRYLRQAGLGYAVATAVDALAGAPDVAQGLIALFRARHDPAFPGDRARGEAAAEQAITAGLAQVQAINHDRFLRACHALLAAILRTNAFLPAGREALAFKIESALVPGLPRPVPWREIFVSSQRVEGIHLRAGPVARGGIRWSDRRDDFRTEVLGLMKAQRVKNAVIVPTGAKGGFYPRQLPDPRQDREGWLAEGREAYRLFIRSLLSLTDSIAGKRVVHPRGMVIRDGDDPYFVVAADKGTASFSDTANALAAEAGFWLDDAFASGGSRGYDHKAMGITARGAWLSVQRHFLELGVDVQADPVRVAGVGDMSGDVFGNGMLLSKAIRLVAAFDHRHVFLDPAPDPAISWGERARLFGLPRSSWDDYDRALLSPGGGIFPRSQKAIPLSPEMRGVLGVEAEVLDPEALIAAILQSPVDLLWFGGIGTYVKAEGEVNAAVGDPANDAVRVNGAQIRARVIGEGANLGCTQAGRIEFALRGAAGGGGRINTDFIDNSAGVDCSDKEVNIKIALAAARRDGRLDEKARGRLLAGMTDDVVALVLEDNRLQALALSIAEAGGAQALPSRLRLIETLEEAGQLDRATEGLAGNEALLRRAAEGQGLVRPELAVLLSSAKLTLQQALEHGALADDPGMAAELLAAFPPALRRRFRDDVLGHRLRREIIATRIANRMINRMGMVHPFELAEEEGASLSQVAAAFVAAESLFGLSALWQAIEDAPMPEPARIRLFASTAGALRGHMADLLRVGCGPVSPWRLVADLARGITALRRAAGTLAAAEVQGQSARLADELAAAGAPPDIAAQVVALAQLDGAVGLARLAADSGMGIAPLTRAFAEVGRLLGLDWAQGAAVRLDPADPWERLLVAGLARDFQHMRLDFLRRITGRKADPLAALAGWLARHEASTARFGALVGRAQAAVPPTPAMLARIAGQARSLLAR